MDISSLGRIVTVWAHPDDESWAAGGLISMALDNNQYVACVIATRGESGSTADEKRWPKDQLGEIRTLELKKALKSLGTPELILWELRDGHLNDVDSRSAIQNLITLFNELSPDTVITFEPEGLTGHQDHKTISEWSVRAAKQAKKKPKVYGACEVEERYRAVGEDFHKKFNVYSELGEPVCKCMADADLCLKLADKFVKKKEAALRAHQSQTSNHFDSESGQKYFDQLCSCECFVNIPLD